MENNNAQTQYNQPPVQQNGFQPQYGTINSNYNEIVKDFLTKAIVSCAISTLPIGSIIAISMATKNRAALLDYLSKGGYHTTRVQVSSALSRAGKYSGIASTIFWGIYLLYFAIAITVAIVAVIAGVAQR